MKEHLHHNLSISILRLEVKLVFGRAALELPLILFRIGSSSLQGMHISSLSLVR